MCLSSYRSIHPTILLYLPSIIGAANSLSCYFPPNTQRSEDVNCHLSHAKITYFDNNELSCHGMQLDGVTVVACSSCESMVESLKAFMPNDTVIVNSLKSIDLPSYRGPCVLSHTDEQGPQLFPAIDEEVIIHGEVTVPLCDTQFVWIYGAAICQCTDCEPSNILENAVTTYASIRAALSQGHQQRNRRSRMIRSVDESTPTAQATLASVTSARKSTASPTSPVIVEIKYDHDTTQAPSIPALPEITMLPSNKSSTFSSQSPLEITVDIPSNGLTTTDANDTTADFLSISTSIETSTSGFSSTVSASSTKRISSTRTSYTTKAKEAKEAARFRARLEAAAARDRQVLDLFGTAVCTIFALPIPVVVTTIVFNLCMDSRRTKV